MPDTPADRPFIVEYYYTAKWGHAEEFLALFKKNHWPVLKKQVESGRFLSVTATKPRYHHTEDGRWDYRVTIVFKNLAAAHGAVGRRGHQEGPFPRPGDLPPRRTAPLRDPPGALGCAHRGGGAG